MDFKDRKELLGFLDDFHRAYDGPRATLARVTGTSMCYFEGSQWIERRLEGFVETTLGRRPISYDPDMNRLRVQSNRVTRFTIKAAAATFPKTLYADAMPSESDMGVEALLAADTYTMISNLMVDLTGYLAVRRRANMRRCISGTWGVGFQRRAAPVSFEGTTYQCSRLKAFDFCPLRLTLDAGEQSPHLHDHEKVCYTDVWTAEKIENAYGIKLDRDKLQTIGQLSPHEQELYNLSGGRIFSYYRQYSDTKGAKVHQLHCKDAAGEFTRMYVVVEVPDKDQRLWVNEGNPVSPFAGDGLPLTLLHGHTRPDSMWSIGEPSMMKDDQDCRNLMLTIFYRMANKYGGWQWLVDKRAFPDATEKGSLAREFSNQPSGVIAYDSGRRDQNIQAPQLLQHPPPQQVFSESAAQSEDAMREQAFRSPGNMGEVKTHTAKGSFLAAIEEADQVLGIRITEDIAADERMIGLGAMTMVKDAGNQDPETLRLLVQNGFGPEEMLQVVRLAGGEFNPSLVLAESNVRFISQREKRNNLSEGLAGQAVTPEEYRFVMAGELDTPLATQDRTMLNEIRKAVANLLRTGQWEPLPLGQFNGWCLTELRRALFERASKRDPAVRQAVVAAIQAQQMVAYQDAATMASAEQGIPDEQGLTPAQGAGNVSSTEPPGTLGELVQQIAGAPA